MNAKKIISITTGLALAASMALAIPAFAQVNVGVGANVNGQQGQGHWNGSMAGGTPGAPGRGPGMPGASGMAMRPGVFGTVTSVNSDIITINGRQGFGSTTAAVSYTVDATNATVKKNNATSTISAIAVGDTIFAQGTVTGTNVVATNIRDGVMTGMRGKGQPGSGTGPRPVASSTPAFVGNGQPVVAGTVSAISGNSLTVTTASNVTYTVDVSSAKVVQGQNTIALSSIVVGNKVLIQGTVNGTSITASTVVDQSAPAGGTPSTPGKAQPRGFFGGIGQFFAHLFGF